MTGPWETASEEQKRLTRISANAAAQALLAPIQAVQIYLCQLGVRVFNSC